MLRLVLLVASTFAFTAPTATTAVAQNKSKGGMTVEQARKECRGMGSNVGARGMVVGRVQQCVDEKMKGQKK